MKKRKNNLMQKLYLNYFKIKFKIKIYINKYI